MVNRRKIYNLLAISKRPIDFFGVVKTEKELKKIYLDFAKQIHPDTSLEEDKIISTEAFVLLQELYQLGLDELAKDIYNLKDKVKLYEKQTPLFSLRVKDNEYDFFELITKGEISDIYCGVMNKSTLVYLKLVLDDSDNELIKEEFSTLDALDFVGLSTIPKPYALVTINNSKALILQALYGENLVEVMKRNPKGLPLKVVMWAMERLFSQVGYLHSEFIIHGNLIPENILINSENHSISLTGFSFSIPNANQSGACYKIKNDDFSAPEVSTSSQVLPQSDIYSIGKLAVYMLGGSLSNNGMPLNIDIKIREFIRKLLIIDVNKRPNDAWKLWDEWIVLRTSIFGTKQFEVLHF